MKTFIVNFSVNGKGRYSITVEANNPGTARDIARGEIQWQYGYVGARITITSVREIR